MADTLEAPPAPNPLDKAGTLPEGIKVNNDYKTDADFYFGKTEREEAERTSGNSQPPTPQPKSTSETAAASTPEKKPTSVSLVDQLTKTATPPESKPPVETQLEDPAADIETKMKATNAKWKPSEGWAELKGRLGKEAQRAIAAEKRALELEEKMKTAPVAAGMTAEEIETLKQREKEASDRLMIADLEHHPKFREEFVAPQNKAISRAQEMLEMHGIKADVASLIGKPAKEIGKSIAELMKDVPAYDQVEISAEIRKAREIEENKRAALGNAKNIREQMSKQGVERQKSAFQKVWMPQATELAKNMVRLVAPEGATPEQVKEVEAYNNGMLGIQTEAEKIALGSMDEEGVARAASKAAAYDFHIKHVQPRILKEFQELRTINMQMADELKAIKSRNPNLRISPTPRGSDTGSGQKDPSQMSHAEAAEYFANRPSQ